MESRYTIHIMPAEWRWVILLASALVFLAFLPLLWVALTDTRDWQFMGTLHNYTDGATYISKMVTGQEGDWLIEFQHTPEPHHGAFIQVIYPLLGHLSRLASLPTIVMFHVARVGASLFMYLALYHLAASIWQRVRTRRIFFAVVALGSGLGWLLSPAFEEIGFMRGAVWPDLQIPEAFPLYSTFMNVHFPLALACLALIASLLITVLRPGAQKYASAESTSAVVGLLSVALSLLYPQALVPIGASLALYVVISWLERKYSAAKWAVRWVLALVLPAVPMAAYYFAIVVNIPAFSEWNRQNVTAAPPLLVMLLGFGLPLLAALPALLRAVRHFEQDDDRLMLVWLLAMLVFTYLPTNVQRRFAVGMMIPIAYFATRAIEDFWFQHISRRYRNYALAIFLPLIAVSQIFVLFLPALPVILGQPQRAAGIFLERDYTRAMRWIDGLTRRDDVILASPTVSVWIPGWARARVVYGHPYETLNAEEKRALVTDWYSSEDTDSCGDLLDRYNIRFVIVGPEERELGSVACAETLNQVQAFGQVGIYAP